MDTVILMGLFAMVMSIGMYVMSALALFTIAKREKQSMPWLAWVPIAHEYLLVKTSKVNIFYIIPGILAFIVSYLQSLVNVQQLNPTGLIGLITSSWLGYALVIIFGIFKLIMYYKLTERYEVAFPLFVLGMIPYLQFVGIYAQYKLYRQAKYGQINQKIQTRVYISNEQKKKKKKKEK